MPSELRGGEVDQPETHRPRKRGRLLSSLKQAAKDAAVRHTSTRR